VLAAAVADGGHAVGLVEASRPHSTLPAEKRRTKFHPLIRSQHHLQTGTRLSYLEKTTGSVAQMDPLPLVLLPETDV
jgi:hypothetical protein